MLTASETRQLSTAAQELDQIDETLIYKYRDEFLHIQTAAVNGLTKLEMLVEDPTEFSQVCAAWGFATTVQDKISAKIVYSKAQNSETIERTTANITVDWTSPKTPTIDVNLYRQSGNLVKLQNSQLSVPLINTLKAKFNVTDQQYQVAQAYVDQAASGILPQSTKTGLGLICDIRAIPNQPYQLIPNNNRTITNPGSGYSVGDYIEIPGSTLGQGADVTGRYKCRIRIEQVAEQRLVNPTATLRGSVNTSVYIIEKGGATIISIEGTAGPSVGGTYTIRDSSITGSTIDLFYG